MRKGNSIILVFTVLLLLIILYVSLTPMPIKLLLAMNTIALLIPIYRKTLVANKGKKIRIAFYTSLIFTVLFTLIALFRGSDLTVEILPFVVIVLFYCLFGNLFYGLPASVIAELVSNQFDRARVWVSGFIHIGMGLATYFILVDFFVPAAICSIIFFALDERMN